jgi:hypothetical protein
VPLKPGDIENVRMSETWSKNEFGTALPAIRIDFTVRKHGPFSVALPKDGYTPQKAMELVNKFAEDICHTLDFCK